MTEKKKRENHRLANNKYYNNGDKKKLSAKCKRANQIKRRKLYLQSKSDLAQKIDVVLKEAIK